MARLPARAFWRCRVSCTLRVLEIGCLWEMIEWSGMVLGRVLVFGKAKQRSKLLGYGASWSGEFQGIFLGVVKEPFKKRANAIVVWLSWRFGLGFVPRLVRGGESVVEARTDKTSRSGKMCFQAIAQTFEL